MLYVAKGTGECPIFKVTRKNSKGEEYTIYAFDLVLSDGDKKRYYSSRGEKKGDFQKRKNQIMLDNQKTVNVKLSFMEMSVFLHNWLVSKRDISDTTKKVYTDYLEAYIKPYIGTTRLQKVTHEDIDRLIGILHTKGGKTKQKDKQGNPLPDKQGKPLAPATLRKVKFMLKQAFDYAIEREYITKNPAQKVTLPPMSKPLIKPLTQEEIKKILDSCKDTPMYYAILLDLSAGLRRGELLALRWQDIDLTTGIANIYRQLVPVTGGVEIKDSLKTDNSMRQVGIPDKVLAKLIKHKEQQEITKVTSEEYFDTGIDNDLVIRQSNGKHYHPRNFARNFDKILSDLNIEKRKIHDMRHSFATHLLTQGAYINEVQIALGHTEAKTTLQNYAHILPGRQKEIANRMNNILPI